MRSRTPALSTPARNALELLGELIKAARKERSMSQSELAERLGVSRHTVMALERGDPKVAVGTVFEAAAVVGVPLVAPDERELARLSGVVAGLASVLPERVGRKRTRLDDDF